MKEQAARNAALTQAGRLCLALAGLLLLVGLSCSSGSPLGGGSSQAVPTPSRTPRATFTPPGGVPTSDLTPQPPIRGDLPPGVTVEAPSAAGTDQAQGSTTVILFATPTGQALVPTRGPVPGFSPLGTPAVAPMAQSPLATATPWPMSAVAATRGPGPTPVPTPFVVVNTAEVQGRRGPDASFELVGQARQGQKLMVLARTPDKSWWQVCCIANQPAWVLGSQVSPQGPIEVAPELPVPPTPTATLTPSPTETLTPSPTLVPPFDLARGPEFPMQRDDGVMIMWVKVFEGPSDNEKPVPGYVLKVFRNGVDVSKPLQSHVNKSGFDSTGPDQGSFLYNLKFEMDRGGEANWQVYLARPDGSIVSPVSNFTTMGDSYRNLMVYLAYHLSR